MQFGFEKAYGASLVRAYRFEYGVRYHARYRTTISYERYFSNYAWADNKFEDGELLWRNSNLWEIRQEYIFNEGERLKWSLCAGLGLRFGFEGYIYNISQLEAFIYNHKSFDPFASMGLDFSCQLFRSFALESSLRYIHMIWRASTTNPILYPFPTGAAVNLVSGSIGLSYRFGKKWPDYAKDSKGKTN